MSALPPTTDVGRRIEHVCFVPLADIPANMRELESCDYPKAGGSANVCGLGRDSGLGTLRSAVTIVETQLQRLGRNREGLGISPLSYRPITLIQTQAASFGGLSFFREQSVGRSHV